MEATPPIAVVLCEDHVLVREGLQRVFDGADDVAVVATASDGEEGIEAALRLRPDVVLMDLVMPRIDGVVATRRIVADAPETKVVVLTSFADEAHILDAIDAGASGYILKDASAGELLRAIRAAAAGHAPLDPRAARVVVSHRATDRPHRDLTHREQEILSLIADGLPTKLIARHLGISDPTVRKHLTNIYRQIGVSDRTQAALWATQRGFGTR
jgi:DNA-binding NarL/FixJ family response regulator